MIDFKKAVREAVILCAAAAVLGFTYTSITNQGLFAKESSATLAPPTIHLTVAESLFTTGNSLFIDARHSFDFKMGHIKGAINIPLAEYDAMKDAIQALPKDNPLVIYCDGAECNSSIQFALRLSSDGFSNAKIFFGGWREWENAGLPIEHTQ